MFISYRRTGGVFAPLTLAAVALSAAVLTVAGAVTALVVAWAIAVVVALLRRAVLPASWRHNTIPSGTPWPQETIEATVLRSDSDKG